MHADHDFGRLFDDALSIAPGEKPSEVVIGVHISDVAAFIAPKSKFDKQAEKRSFSCYLPGRTLPMLPKALTAKISLQAGEELHALVLQPAAQRPVRAADRNVKDHGLVSFAG